MKESFHRSLNQANAWHKERAADEERSPEEEQASRQALFSLITATAGEQATDAETQFEVLYQLQGQKREVMERLREQLQCLDDPECEVEAAPEARALSYDEASEQLQYVAENGDVHQVTKGMLLTDAAWGLTYGLPPEAPRALQKRYLVAQARYELQALLDEQIIHNETASAATHEYRQAAYRAIKENTDSGERERQSGIIAERMAEGMLTQFSYDGDLPFSVTTANVYEDVVEKADFFIRKKYHERAVTVDAGEVLDEHDEHAEVAVQFTTDSRDATRERKETQLKRAAEEAHVKDAVLVTFSDINVQRAYRQWEQAGHPPGGPVYFLERHTRRKLFEALLKHMFTTEELMAMWGQAGR